MAQEPELQALRRYLKKSGMRYTPEREQIVREIFARHDHFDVDTLYLQMRQKGTSVSKASIYRLLPLLIEGGLLNEVYLEDGHMHYEHIYGHAHHCHLRCMECGSIEEFTDPRLPQIEQDLGKRFDYEVKGYKLDVYGFCPKCRQLMKVSDNT